MPRAGWIFILLVALGVPATVHAWEVVLYEGRRHVPLENVAEFYSLKQLASEGNKFTLTSPVKTITGSAGAREIIINNVKFILCFPIAQKDGRTLISAMDVTKIIEPVMRPGKIKDAGVLKTVVLDAGHGGHDSGATSAYGREKDFTLDVAQRARKLLVQLGYQVRMTRQSDEFIPLEGRAAIANRYRDGIFVSIHFNKSNNPGGNGIETYALAPRGVPSMDSERVSFSDLREHTGNIRDAENITLATLMHSAMLRNLRLYDRGIKRARFVVIKDITIPGVLLEGGFVNHPGDGRSIASQEYRQRMAQSIVEAIGNYKRMVTHDNVYVQPTLVVSAGDPGPNPALASPAPVPTPVPKVGEKTSVDEAVAKLNLEESVSEKPRPNLH
ncbi:MAG: N-acetylmuramoyl-L-alanine amidase [Chthoniobacterales bacterium]